MIRKKKEERRKKEEYYLLLLYIDILYNQVEWQGQSKERVHVLELRISHFFVL
jgi:hypothetical protein